MTIIHVSPSSFQLSYPDALLAAVRAACPPDEMFAAFGEPAARAALRLRLARVGQEQREHDAVRAAAERFVAGLISAHLSAYENCLSTGVTLLDNKEWQLLFDGLARLLQMAVADVAGTGPVPPPARPPQAGWRDGYDPGQRWQVGNQLFSVLVQGATTVLNCFADAVAGQAAEAEEGLALAAAFLRSSAVAMKLASDFAPADYDCAFGTLRPVFTISRTGPRTGSP